MTAGLLSDRDRLRLASVHPLLVEKLTRVFQAMAETPLFVVQGVRTTEQQQADYAKGRPDNGPIVTECDGVKVKGPHQVHSDGYGYAADLAFLSTPERPLPFDPSWPWTELGEAIENEGLIWGGRFHFGDLDHAELPAQTEKAA